MIPWFGGRGQEASSGRHGRATPIEKWLGGIITNPQQPLGNDDYVWPQDLQFNENYTRAGTGSLGGGDIRDPNASKSAPTSKRSAIWPPDYYGTEQACAAARNPASGSGSAP